jgi:hypothetical protein
MHGGVRQSTAEAHDRARQADHVALTLSEGAAHGVPLLRGDRLRVANHFSSCRAGKPAGTIRSGPQKAVAASADHTDCRAATAALPAVLLPLLLLLSIIAA